MRNLLAVGIVAVAGLFSAPAMAADLPEYPPYIPPVDYGLDGSFYLRGSVDAHMWTAREWQYCGPCAIESVDGNGYGYSFGVGVGYETGTGFRTDLTLDYLYNSGLPASSSGSDYTVDLRSGLLLANVYYDIPLSGDSLSAEGGTSFYLGAGIGGAYNYSQVFNSGGTETAWGTTFEAAAAVMAGVSYDMGDMVADLGYRGIYMDKVMSQPPNLDNAYLISENFIHEVRATLRYRIN